MGIYGSARACGSGGSREMEAKAKAMAAAMAEMQLNACQPAAVNVKTPVLDGVMAAVFEEVLRCENSIQRLIEKLETPRPADRCEGQPKPQPPTLDIALGEICSRLANCNEDLRRTIERLDDQVGELKILP